MFPSHVSILWLQSKCSTLSVLMRSLLPHSADYDYVFMSPLTTLLPGNCYLRNQFVSLPVTFE